MNPSTLNNSKMDIYQEYTLTTYLMTHYYNYNLIYFLFLCLPMYMSIQESIVCVQLPSRHYIYIYADNIIFYVNCSLYKMLTEMQGLANHRNEAWEPITDAPIDPMTYVDQRCNLLMTTYASHPILPFPSYPPCLIRQPLFSSLQ